MFYTPLQRVGILLKVMLLASHFLWAQSAMFFDGTNDYVQFPNQTAYNFNSFTFETWIALSSNPGTDVAILSNRDNLTNGVEWGIHASGRQMLTIAGSQLIEPTVDLYQLQGCTHIAVTYDNSSGIAAFYINGTLIYQDLLPNATATGSDLWLGANPATVSKFYRGGLDELRVWNFALAPGDLAQWWNVNCPNTYGPYLLYVNFDEVSSSQFVHDQSPLANHGIRGSIAFTDANDPQFVNPFCSFATCCAVNADFTGPQPAYAGAPATFTNTSTAGLSYEWFVDGVSVGTSTNLTYTFTAVGSYVVTLRAQGSTQPCYDYYSWVVEVEDPCNANFSYTANCNSISFMSTPTVPGIQHFWDFGDGGSSNLANPTHLYMAPGTYTVTHTVSFMESCTETVTQQITISCFNDPCPTDCNIVPWGDFEDHNITELDPLFFHKDLWLPSLAVPIDNSMELYNGTTGTVKSSDNLSLTNQMLLTLVPVLPAAATGGDQYVGIAASRYLPNNVVSLNREIMTFELCEPIQPGEVYDVSMLLQLHVGDAANTVFRLQGSAEEACPFWSQSDLTICPDEGCNVMCNNGNSYTPYDMAAFYQLNGSWTSHSTTYQHPANAPALNYITIFPEVNCPATGVSYVLVDNISICPSDAQAGAVVVPNPNVNASFSYVITPPNCTETFFTSNGANGVHSWDFGDGNSSTAVNPTHTYSSTGTYTVTHTITDGNCFGSEVMTIEVKCPNCSVDPWPRIYETSGGFGTEQWIVGLDFDANNNVYALRTKAGAVNQFASAVTVLSKYCDDGLEEWSSVITGGEMKAWETNNKLAVDDNGNSFVIVGYENSMNVDGTVVSGTGAQLAILKYNTQGTLVNWRSIPYVFSTGFGAGNEESVKVNDAGNKLYVLTNDRIKELNSNTLLDVVDELGSFFSIDISDNGNFIYFVDATDVGFYNGLGSTPMSITHPGAGVKTDFEFDDVNDRVYLATNYDVHVYDVTSTTIVANFVMNNVTGGEFYREICPTPTGLMIYVADVYLGGPPIEDVHFYNLSGGPTGFSFQINGNNAVRTPILMGYNNGNGYLGATWFNSLNMGWYSTSTNSGSYVTRFDMNGTLVPKHEENADNTFGLASGDASVQLFPNPSQGEVEVNIAYDGLANVQVAVVDAYGQIVHMHGPVDVSSGEGYCRLDLAQEPAGIYFVVVEREGVRLSTKKLILR